MQLVAYGAQDIYLTGNPQITFFKVVYRRHTNFSMETIQQTMNGSPTDGGNSTVTISRNGDLVYKVYVTLAAGAVIKGSDLVDEVELEIGGQLIDRQYQEWVNIWNELSTPESKSTGLKSMICDIGTRGTDGVGNIQVPLQFWFCRNPGLALPLIALQYHEVKLKLKWGSSHGGTTASAQVWADYIYLDTDERRRFAQVSHEYLIEQVQRQSCSGNDSTKLNFNHPVKELIWTSVSTNSYGTAQLKLNGHDRFAAQEEEYFQLRQPYDYHTAVPGQNLPGAVVKADELKFLLGSTIITVNDGKTVGTALTATEYAVPYTAAATPSVTTAGNFFCVFAGLAAAGTPDAGSIGAIELPVVGDTHLIISNISKAGATLAAATIVTTVAKVKAIYTLTANKIDTFTPATSLVSGGRTFISTAQAGLHQSNMVIEYENVVHGGGTTTNATTTGNSVAFYKVNDAGARTSQMTKKINVYSFALKPEEHQPSGTCNFSRIDNAKLDTASSGTALTSSENIYAVNYNVLRIMSGMGGLAYSN